MQEPLTGIHRTAANPWRMNQGIKKMKLDSLLEKWKGFRNMFRLYITQHMLLSIEAAWFHVLFTIALVGEGIILTTISGFHE